MLRREWHTFLTAFLFYTRIPLRVEIPYSEELLNRSTRYFPLIGWFVAAIGVVCWYGGTLLLGDFLGATLGVLSMIWVTGAFHEDGLADVCDGFGGGWTQEKILNVMKDSRVGTYGVVALCVMLILKVGAMVAFGELVNYQFKIIALWLLSAHGLSRWLAASIMLYKSYVREDELSKVKPVVKKAQWSGFLIGGVFALLPLTYLLIYTRKGELLIALGVAILVKIMLARFFDKWIGGYTGDCLGAAQQVCEVVFCLTSIAIWKFT